MQYLGNIVNLWNCGLKFSTSNENTLWTLSNRERVDGQKKPKYGVDEGRIGLREGPGQSLKKYSSHLPFYLTMAQFYQSHIQMGNGLYLTSSLKNESHEGLCCDVKEMSYRSMSVGRTIHILHQPCVREVGQQPTY